MADAEVETASDAEPCTADLKAAVKIEWGMVKLVIAALRERGFQYVVAPYEADSQLVHLCRTGCIDAVITVDSDLVVLGAKTGYFRVNYFTGDALVLQEKDLGSKDEAGDGDASDDDEAMEGSNAKAVSYGAWCIAMGWWP